MLMNLFEEEIKNIQNNLILNDFRESDRSHRSNKHRL